MAKYNVRAGYPVQPDIIESLSTLSIVSVWLIQPCFATLLILLLIQMDALLNGYRIAYLHHLYKPYTYILLIYT